LARIDDRILLWLLRGCYGTVFGIAGLAKLFRDDKTIEALLLGIGTPPAITAVAVAVLPWLELLLGFWFFTNWRQWLRNLVTCACLGIFALFLILGAKSGVKVCGCFGRYYSESIESAIVRDIALTAGALFLAMVQGSRNRNESPY